MSEPEASSPLSFIPPKLPGERASGDGWVEDGSGAKFWGRFGAAGLLAHDASRGILMQHRANWSHHGGTWGLPGGARHEDETAVQAAVREATEEAGIAVGALKLRFTSTLDLGFWSYTTVVVDVVRPFDAKISDAESIEIRWVPVDEVDALPLHPGFASSWPGLRAELERPAVIVVDSANVVGSRPDGWWKDRLGATERFASSLSTLSEHGFAGAALGFDSGQLHWWPAVRLVVEGQASAAQVEPAVGIEGGVSVVAANRDGDQQIVDTVAAVFDEAAASFSPRVYVVTADRELSARVSALGAEVRGPSWLWELLDASR